DVVRAVPSRTIEVAECSFSAEAATSKSPASGGSTEAIPATTTLTEPTITVQLPPPRARIEPLSENFTRIAFSADQNFVALLEETSAALSHLVPDGDLQSVFRISLRSALETVARRRLGATAAAARLVRTEQPASA